MRKTLPMIALAIASLGTAHAVGTSLANGDFAFTGLNVNTTVGGWSFVSFVDLAAGTTLFFTDTNVLQTPTSAGVFSTAPEVFWSWTASADVAAGTSVALLGNGTSGQYTARSGAAGGSPNGIVTNLTGGASNISSSGDILYAYQAAAFATNYQPADIRFLGAISNRGSYGSSDHPTAATGLSGIQLREFKVDASTATRYTQFTPQVSTSDTPYGSMAGLQAALAASANWTTVAGSNSLPIVSDVLAVSAVPEPQGLALWMAGLGVIGALAGRRSRSR